MVPRKRKLLFRLVCMAVHLFLSKHCRWAHEIDGDGDRQLPSQLFLNPVVATPSANSMKWRGAGRLRRDWPFGDSGHPYSRLNVHRACVPDGRPKISRAIGGVTSLL